MRPHNLRCNRNKISINFMIADPLTKGVPPKVFHEHVAHMCVVHLGDTYV
uniref:Uncharacterized protein n=1 Tax=Vitis vinifera TaxID=29760 RepID=F6HRA1_VITVI